jgi:acid phosphatase type 7
LRRLVAGALAFLATVFLLTGRLYAAPSVLKGPYVTALSDSDATIRFELATAAPATLEVTAQANAAGDAGASRPGRFESREVSAMHRVRVSGLQPATPYAFVVRVGGTIVGDGRVVTAPRPDAGTPLTFLVYGDNRTDDAAHASVVRAMNAVPSDFLVNTGDMIQDGASAPNWQTFFDIEKPLLHERALFAAIGNHELYDDASGANFERYFGFPDETPVAEPYGTVRFGNARFFFLNGADDLASGAEREWLEHALTSADGEAGLQWRFVVLHHGPWSAGPHGSNVKLVEAGVVQVLTQHRVDLLFAGHDHIYERGMGGALKYIVSGGGGAPLYRDLHPLPTTRKAEAVHHFIEVTTRGDDLETVAMRDDGSVLDRCGFARGRPWDCDGPVRGTVPEGPSGSDTTAVLPKPSTPSSHGCVCGEPGESASAGGVALALAALSAVWLARSRRRG